MTSIDRAYELVPKAEGWAENCNLLGCKNVVPQYHSCCCILRTCLGCSVRLVHTYYICTYVRSRKLGLLQRLSLQHVMVSELCTDFTATLHLSPGLYSSYSRLSWFMSILYIICASCDFCYVVQNFLACYSHLSLSTSHLSWHRSFLVFPTRDLTPHLDLFDSLGTDWLLYFRSILCPWIIFELCKY